MRLNLPKKTIDYLILGIIAGAIAGIAVFLITTAAIETAQGVRGAALKTLNPLKQ